MRNIYIYRNSNDHHYYISDKSLYEDKPENLLLWTTLSEEDIEIPPTQSDKILLRPDIINKEIKRIIENKRIWRIK